MLNSLTYQDFNALKHFKSTAQIVQFAFQLIFQKNLF